MKRRSFPLSIQQSFRAGTRHAVSLLFAGMVSVLLLHFPLLSQQGKLDSLHAVLLQQKEDTNRVNTLVSLCGELTSRDTERALECGKEALQLAQKLSFKRGTAGAYLELGRVYDAKGEKKESQRSLEIGLNLARELKEAKTIVRALYSLSWITQKQGKYDGALSFAQEALKIAEGIKDKSGIAASLNNIGIIYIKQGRYEQALDYYQRSLKLKEELGDKTGIAASLGEIGIIHRKQGRYEQALDYFQRSLKLSEELGEKYSIAASLNNIGNILSNQGRYEKALEYYQRSLELMEELGDKSGIAASLNNVGNIHFSQGRYEKALDYYQRRLRIQEEIGGSSIACTLHNIGVIHDKQGRYEQAVDYYQRSLKLSEELGDKSGIAGTLDNIGEIHDKQGSYEQAVDYYQRSLAIAREIGKKEGIKNVLQNLSELYSKRGDFVKAYEYHKEFVTVKDSLLNEANIKSINEMTAKYESEKKEQQIALAEQQIALLEKDKTLSDLEALKNREQLRVRKLETERIRKNALLLSQQNDINLIALEHRTTELELRTKELELQRLEKEKKAKEVEVLAKDRELQASIISRDKVAKDAMLIGFVLLVALSVLTVKRSQAKRREASLRAEAAEYQAKAAEAESLRISAEAAQREKEAQHLFSQRLISSQEQERRRIAFELHDGVNQNILVVKNRAFSALRRGTMDEETQRQLEEILETAETSIQEVREVSLSLRPAILERAGLRETLASMLSKVGESSEIGFEVHIDELQGAFREDEEINVFRIVQESMNNVLKHSGASRSSVTVTRSHDTVEIVVADDGKGLPADLLARQASSGLGLQSIGERVTMMNGQWNIESGEGKGTRVHVRLPVQNG